MKTTFTKDELINYLESKGNEIVRKMHQEKDIFEQSKFGKQLDVITEEINDLGKAIKGE